MPPLVQLQKLATLAAVAPAEVGEEPERSWLIRRRVTDEMIVQIVRLYEHGVGTPKLCADFGISKPSMLELLHGQGVQMRRQPLTAGQRAEAVQLYESGLAVKPIARRLDSSFGAVHRVLKAEGVRLRPRPGR